MRLGSYGDDVGRNAGEMSARQQKYAGRSLRVRVIPPRRVTIRSPHCEGRVNVIEASLPSAIMKRQTTRDRAKEKLMNEACDWATAMRQEAFRPAFISRGMG